MNINTTTPSLMFQGRPKKRDLRPLQKHEGPLLELTEQNKTEISKIEKEIEMWTARLRKINFIDHKDMDRGYIKDYSVSTCNQKIKICQEKIRNIKIARFTEQKKAYEASLQPLKRGMKKVVNKGIKNLNKLA